MNNYNELLQKISSVNAQVQTLNKERQVNLGKKQALETQLSTAIANYKASYGVDLTPETVEAEYNKVLAEKQAEVAKLETTLSAIKQGNFEEAQVEVQQANTVPLMGMEMTQANAEVPKANTVSSVNVEMPQAHPTRVEKPVNVEVPQTQANAVPPTRVEMPQANAVPPTRVEQTHVVAPTPAPAPHVEAPTPQPVTVPISQAAAPTSAPASTMTPVSSTPVSAPPINFNSILSGTDFQ